MGTDTRWIKSGSKKDSEFLKDILMDIDMLEPPSGDAAVEQVVGHIKEIISTAWSQNAKVKKACNDECTHAQGIAQKVNT